MPTNRPPVDEQRHFFKQVYEAFLGIDMLEGKRKYAAFETLLENSKMVDFWVVNGISLHALAKVAKQEWSAKGLKRAHSMSRFERGVKLFGPEAPMPNAFDFYMQNDTVTLVTATENAIDGTAHWSEVYPLDPELFGWHTGWGVHPMNRRQRSALQELHASIAAGVDGSEQ